MDEPIDEQGYVAGMTVVDFGDIRVARGMTRRAHAVCKHRRLNYDPKERRIWCKDCEKDVEAFDAFQLLAQNAHAVFEGQNRREKEITEARAFAMRSIAAKTLDEAWRSKNMVPACPHCGMGLFPEHFKNGVTKLGKDYAEAALKRRKPAT